MTVLWVCTGICSDIGDLRLYIGRVCRLIWILMWCESDKFSLVEAMGLGKHDYRGIGIT